MSKYLYGIDFGTTNSALSIFDEGKQEIIETITIPSLLYFSSGIEQGGARYSVGHEAIKKYIDEGMEGRFMKSVKRILPRSNFTDTRIGGHKYTAPYLVALIIKELKNRADIIIGESCEKAVIGRPVFFDDDDTGKDDLAQQRLATAVQKAGLKDVRFQFEPIGAAFAYERTITKKEKVLVADFGGGTTDFAFIELDPAKIGKKDRRKDIITSGGVYVGGDSFDSSFMWERGTPYFGKGVRYDAGLGKMLDLPLTLFANICSWEKMNFFNGQKIKNDLNRYYTFSRRNPQLKNLITLIENNLGYSVFRAIEKTKIHLSDADMAAFSYSQMAIDIDETISIDEYNEIIKKDLAKISDYLTVFLSKNNIQPGDVDSLFLTGGTSLVKAIRAMFAAAFPNVPIHSGDNFISVAKGLAYSGYLFE